MFTTLRNAWKIPELRKKLLFTLFILLVFRAGTAIPVPFVNVALLSEYFSQQLSNTILGLYNAMSGSAFSQASLFALSIQPYINASIILQLLTIAIPALERLQKEGGEEGQRKIAAYTRYATVLLGLLMGYAYYVMLRNYGLLTQTGFLYGLVIVLSFTAGSAFVMWLGEQITEFGIGNGISLILFAGIVSRLPSAIGNTITNIVNGGRSWIAGVGIFAVMLLIIVFIVFITNSERRIPVQYAKRVVGRKVYGGQNTHLPIKLDMSGVMPIIFAQSIASLPATIAAFLPAATSGFGKFVSSIINPNGVVYAVVYFFLIVAFSYFYAAIQYNPMELANNLKKNGGFVPGFRPGKPTADFIKKVINKITLFGALYLAVIALLPIIVGNVLKYNALSIGGTSVIIVVGVALETVKVLEAQMMMRHYKGFLE